MAGAVGELVMLMTEVQQAERALRLIATRLSEAAPTLCDKTDWQGKHTVMEDWSAEGNWILSVWFAQLHFGKRTQSTSIFF